MGGARDESNGNSRSQSSHGPRVKKAGRGRFLIEMNSDDETDVWLVRPQLGPQSCAEEVEPIPEMEPLPLNAHDEACDDHEIAIIEEMWLHTTSL